MLGDGNQSAGDFSPLAFPAQIISRQKKMLDMVCTSIAHVHVLGKGVHGHAFVADDSTRLQRSVVLLQEVKYVPDITKQGADAVMTLKWWLLLDLMAHPLH